MRHPSGLPIATGIVPGVDCKVVPADLSSQVRCEFAGRGSYVLGLFAGASPGETTYNDVGELSIAVR